MNKTRVFSLLLALVVLISCLPVIPAAAANSMTLEGVWEIRSGWEQSFDEGRIPFFEISVDAYVLIQGEKHRVTSISIDEQEPQTLAVSSSLWSERAFESSGYTVTDDGCIYFNRLVTITDPGAIAFFTFYATQDTSQTYKLIVDDHEVHSHFSPWYSQSIVDSEGTTFECTQCSWTYAYTYSGEGVFNGFVDASGKKYFDQCIFDVSTAELRLTSTTTSSGGGSGSTQSYSSTISIDGQKFTFTSSTEKPSVLLEVLSDGAKMSYGDQTLYYIYPGSDTFLGLGASPTGAAVFVPGESYPLAAGDLTLFAIEESAGSAAVSVVVDDETFTFSADEFPVYITVTVTESGCQLTDGERVFTYAYSGEGVFSGLTFVSGSDPVYFVGDQFSVEFRDAANSTCTLYSCFDLEGQGLAGILEVLKNLYKKFIGWIDGSISIPEIVGSLNIVDFGSVGSFFVDAYQNVTSLFGLKDLLEDPAGPFAWLIE